jgi:RNase P protein component
MQNGPVNRNYKQVHGRKTKRHRYKRAVRKVYSLFEYLENRSRGLDVNLAARGDLTVHP